MSAYPSDVLNVDEWMHHPGCTRDDLNILAHLMANFPHPWYFCGGWAIDLFLGKPMRAHKEVDIGIFRPDQLEIQNYLAVRGWEMAKAADGLLTQWSLGERLELPCPTIWYRNSNFAPPFVELIFEEGSEAEVGFRRNPTVTRSGTKAICYGVDGLPYLAPEIALLYKAAHVERVENQTDLDNALPHLTEEQRTRLKDGLVACYGHHPWLAKLDNE